MSSNASPFEQQAVFIPPSVDDIFRIYILDRLSTTFKEFVTELVVGISLSAEDHLKCLEALNELEKKNSPKQLSSALPIQTALLPNCFARCFQDGVISWCKIFAVLNSIVKLICYDITNVSLVDHLCHYSKTIHVSSEGETISSWIQRKDDVKPLHQEKDVKMEVFTTQEQSVSNEKKSTVVINPYIKCPCGYKVRWTSEKYPICLKCRCYPCRISACRKKYEQFPSLRQHQRRCHSKKEMADYEAEYNLYRILFCSCGQAKPPRDGFNYARCKVCKKFLCLRGACTSEFGYIQTLNYHQWQRCQFPPTAGKKCKSCGADKTNKSNTASQCANLTCIAFWCPVKDCDFESTSMRSISAHLAARHRYK